MRKVNKLFQILSGGYQITLKNGKWSQVFGSEKKMKAFRKEDRRQHRSELRLRAERNKLKRSKPESSLEEAA